MGSDFVPAHYAGDGKIHCNDAMKSMVTGCRESPMVILWRLLAFKYVWREDRKGGIADIDKAIDCLEKMKAQKIEDEMAEEKTPF